MCEELRPDRDELIDRLRDAAEAALPIESCLDEPEDYLAVLGPDGIATLRDGHHSEV